MTTLLGAEVLLLGALPVVGVLAVRDLWRRLPGGSFHEGDSGGLPDIAPVGQLGGLESDSDPRRRSG